MIFKISDNELIDDRHRDIAIIPVDSHWDIVLNDKFDSQALGIYSEFNKAKSELQNIHTAYSQGKNTYTMGVE